MGDRMTPISFAQLLHWMMGEKKEKGSVFGVQRAFLAKNTPMRTICGRNLELPVGPAAGPHTQLAQNIAAAYYAGSRFFELKTVQIIDGEELPVSKPCIKAADEGYNVEWSTELYVPQACEEYIKAWFLLYIMAKEWGLGSIDGFQFNMSVGYDLEGIRSAKINTFIESMKDAATTAVFQNCKKDLIANLSLFQQITEKDIEEIPSQICNSVTLSTLHGCPPQEIERIALYLLAEKGLHTFVKCNPTLLGYEFARKTMDDLGYDYLSFGDFHFLNDLQYEDAVPMFRRLQTRAANCGLEFGVKLTNTFPTKIKAGELPGEEMYMSGRSLYPLSVSLAAKLAEEFDGKLRISYSGGADSHSIGRLIAAGIWPVTVATTLLKPGGYQRISQLASLADRAAEEGEASARILTRPPYSHMEDVCKEKPTEKSILSGAGAEPTVGVYKDAPMKSEVLIAVPKVKKMAVDALRDPYYRKPIKPAVQRKSKEPLPLLDCFIQPCQTGCPIRQDITAYMQLVSENRYEEALEVITRKNPLPFITGTICPHHCMSKCTRNFYEEPVAIRQMKLLAAENGYDAFMKKISPPEIRYSSRTAVVGGGPAGLAAAFFLAREGMSVTLFEQNASLGGLPKRVIPEFRIPQGAISKDITLIKAMGMEVKLRTRIDRIEELRDLGFDFIVLAVGASGFGELKLEGGQAVNALLFLEEFKSTQGRMNLGEKVVVVGGGNTAMDAARAAGRVVGVKEVSLLYRRTRRYMPADEEELELALRDGIQFKELLTPVKWEKGQLSCRVMALSEPDVSGRKGVVQTQETVIVPANTVIAAVGERVAPEFYTANGIRVSEDGKAVVDETTLQTELPGVYVIGDGLGGPATVVEAIRDAGKAVEAILKKTIFIDYAKVDKDKLEADTQNKGKSITVRVEIERSEEGQLEEGQLEADRSEASMPGMNRSDKEIYAIRGILEEQREGATEAERCLSCGQICENCVESCPNRANLSIRLTDGRRQILHIDTLCNECGNCKVFCPYDGAPYLDKFTLFASRADLENSSNQGFSLLDSDKAPDRAEGMEVKGDEPERDRPEETDRLCMVRFQGEVFTCRLSEAVERLPGELFEMMKRIQSK